MEAVAIGAAIQGAVLAGEVKDILLLDVTPLSLGVETLGGIATRIIEKNTTIPTKKSQVFSTASDFQTAVTIHVVQGERPMAADNMSLGMFNLTGLPPAPRGVPQIEVTYDIDANGIINVSAKDLGTGKEAKITITASTKLSKEEKERLTREAEQFAEQDKRRKEEVELRNEADSNIYTAEQTKKQLEGKIGQPEVEKIDRAVQELKKVLDGKEVMEIRSKNETLKKVLQEVGTTVYQQQAAQQQAAQQQQQTRGGQRPQEGGGAQPEGNGVDADYTVVDDEGKRKR